MDGMARPHRAHSEQPIRITTAAASRNADIASREKRYIISMSIRSVCFIGAVVTFIAGITWAWPILIAGALVLPYVAVVMANANNSKGENFSLMDSPYGRPELRGGKQTRDYEREHRDDD
jgi:hypothetical protein